MGPRADAWVWRLHLAGRQDLQGGMGERPTAGRRDSLFALRGEVGTKKGQINHGNAPWVPLVGATTALTGEGMGGEGRPRCQLLDKYYQARKGSLYGSQGTLDSNRPRIPQRLCGGWIRGRSHTSAQVPPREFAEGSSRAGGSAGGGFSNRAWP